ncbi:hypothetical protein BKD02_06900 [Brucella sp. 09RB8910]|nr:hypothetical protein BKD02_06900 [Brucella sp. 09RB8910]
MTSIVMEHFRHRPHEGKTILAVYGGRKLNGFAVNSKRFLTSALIKIAYWISARKAWLFCGHQDHLLRRQAKNLCF